MEIRRQYNNINVHEFHPSEESCLPFELYSYNKLTVVTSILAENFLPHRHNFYEEFLLLSSQDKSNTHEFTFFDNMMRSPIFKISAGQKRLLDSQLKSMQMEYNSSEPCKATILRAYLHIFLVTVQRMYEKTFPEKNEHNNQICCEFNLL